MSLLCEKFSFDWPLELLHPNSQMGHALPQYIAIN